MANSRSIKKRKVAHHVGWREWVSLPELKIKEIKVKVDTGAKTSALHASNIKIVRRGNRRFARFDIHPYQKNTEKTVRGMAPLLETRQVRSSTGHETDRPVIVTELCIGGVSYPIEVTLVNRDLMGFRMLLGRQALRGSFLVDPSKSFLFGKRPPITNKTKKNKSSI